MNIAVILAAGQGLRMKSQNKTPKQFLFVNEIPLLVYTLRNFSKHQNIDKILIVTIQDYLPYVQEMIKQYQINKVLDIIPGGTSRQESVFKALLYLENKIQFNDVLLIHDGARPLINEVIIDRNIICAKEHGACSTAIKETNTLITSFDNMCLAQAVDRSQLFVMQTPQSFQYQIIKDAHQYAQNNHNQSVTDDAQLVLANNHPVYIVEGSPLNIKITTNDDLLIFKALLSRNDNQ